MKIKFAKKNSEKEVIDLFEVLLNRQPSRDDIAEFRNRNLTQKISAILQSSEFIHKYLLSQSDVTKLFYFAHKFEEFFPRTKYLREVKIVSEEKRLEIMDYFQSNNNLNVSLVKAVSLFDLIMHANKVNSKNLLVFVLQEEFNLLNLFCQNFMQLSGFFRVQIFEQAIDSAQFSFILEEKFSYLGDFRIEINSNSQWYLALFE